MTLIDPLDPAGEGDDAIEMCLFFDENGKKKCSGSQLPSSSGCCMVFWAVGASIGRIVWGVQN